ncbi:MAG: ATP-binding protein [Alphaproteobacteria bacterium]
MPGRRRGSEGEREGRSERLLRLLAVGTLVLPLLLFIGFAWRAYELRFREAEEGLGRTVGLLREHAIKVFETQDLVAAQVAQMLRGLGDDVARAREFELHGQLRHLKERLPQIQDIWVIDARGRPLATAVNYPVPRTLDLSDREYFRVHRDDPGRGMFVSEVLRGRLRDVTFFQMSWGFGDGGTFQGVVAVSVQPEYFRDFYANVAGDEDLTATLLREDGTPLARFPAPPQGLASTPPSPTFARTVAPSPDGGSYRAVSPFDGTERIVAYRRLPAHPVYVSAGIPISYLREQWALEIAGHLVFGAPATLALFLVTVVALRRTRRETEALAQLRAEAALREATEAQLRQSQKMDAIGRLTGGIAHDFNNLLTVVTGNLDLALRRLGEGGDPRLRRRITGALEGASRAAGLTQRLLAFARQQPLDPKPTDVNRLVAGMSDLLHRTLGETIAVETVLGGGVWPVFADGPQLESAILNLAVNARDAMPAGGKLTIETANTHLDDAYAAAHSEVTAGQYVMVAVSDTGSGMPADVVARAFDPFFTTKPQGGGTGLGLSQVYGFVKQSGGHVKIYSEPGDGTAVKIYLPRHGTETGPTEPPPVRALAAESLPRIGDGRIALVVEDDPGVRAVSVEALRELGFSVLEAGDAATALRVLDQEPAIGLLFTDVVLPRGVNGRQLADEARRRRPDLPVLFTTGYTQNAIVHNGMLDPGVSLIGKPFTLAALARKLEQMGRSAA